MDIRSMNLEEMEALAISLGEKAFRGKQLFQWVHEKQADDFDEMTNLSAAFREKLKENYCISGVRQVEKQVSKKEDTAKYLFALEDDHVIESVWMKYRHGNSVCISSQVGCRMGCTFCASTLTGLTRNLTAGEMLSQIYQIQKDTKERVSNIIVMGMGEPLDNYEELLRFIKLVSCEKGIGISQRNITVSTCGLVDKIRMLADEKLQITLAISLHAPNDEIRRQTMPIANRYTIGEIIQACKYYFDKTGRRITFEYSMIRGVNDKEEHAKELAEEKVPGCLGQTKWYPSTVTGILKQEKHMGDALLQKTYTADFLTKRQVRNNGEIAQVYVKDSHKGIIDKQTWNAVQEEFDRREKFMELHGTDRYSYGADCMPFCEKVFCGECKSLFTRHSWRSRGIVQWQCKNHRKDGKVACTNAYVDNADLEKGFVKAFNRLVTDRDKNMERWQQMKSDGTPLEKIRAGQMMEAVGNEPLTRFVPEIAQLVLCEVTVLGAKKYEFFFLEGSRVKVSV